MKLDIGSGRKRHRGYKTIDIEEYAKPDYLGDFRNMSFEDIDEIRTHHLLEHFSRKETLNILKQWHSWLKPGGKIIIETPDFENICKDFIVDMNWMEQHTYGSQEADWAFHKSGWWEDKFRRYFKIVGFEVLEVRRNKSRKILPNIMVIGKKN